MPIFTPGRRWQPAYSPFKQESFGNLVMENLEYVIKGPLFGCRMCGNCMLQETAFICPMECPKGLRNGPCGGSTPEHCYVDKTRPCIWYKIYERSFKLGREIPIAGFQGETKYIRINPLIERSNTATVKLESPHFKIARTITVI